jgi:hypothetical protein
MTQGKIERWYLSLKSLILLENYYFPGDLERAVADRRALQSSPLSREPGQPHAR